MEKRIITIPETPKRLAEALQEKVVNEEAKEGEEAFTIVKRPLTFAIFIRYFINSDRRFNSGGPGIRAGARVDAALDECEPGTTFELRDEDVKLLLETLNKPEVQGQGQTIELPYPVRPAHPCAVYIQAIEDAKRA